MTKNITASKGKAVKIATTKPKQKLKEIKQVPGQQLISKFFSHGASGHFSDSSNATTIDSGSGKEDERDQRYNRRHVHFADSDSIVPSTQNKSDGLLVNAKKINKRVAPIFVGPAVKSQLLERQSTLGRIFSLANSIVLYGSQRVFVRPTNNKQHEEFIVSICQR